MFLVHVADLGQELFFVETADPYLGVLSQHYLNIVESWKMVLVLSCRGSRCISHESGNSLQLEFFCKICIYFKYICYILFGGVCMCAWGGEVTG